MKPLHVFGSKYRLYSPNSLTKAYLAVHDGISVKKAAREYGVPTQTLRDRVKGKISVDCVQTGKAPLFTQEEEARMTGHFKEMATYGYGYTCKEVLITATEFAIELGRRNKGETLTDTWFRGYLRRWPELKVMRPRALEHLRASAASPQNIGKYFQELDKVLLKYNLKNKPHLIFNIDEKGITLNHTPPHIVAGSKSHPPAITSGKSHTTTVIGCGSASGVAVPPYFVFPGTRMREELLSGATPGADGCVSETGWSNSEIFKSYISDHLFKFVPGRKDEKILLLVDGHKSHTTVGLIEWARAHNVIIHILPAHTSHLLQPLDVSCFGPFQRIYNVECHKKIRSSTAVITKHDVCEIACKAYSKALSPDNLQAGFKKTGIFPFNAEVLPAESLAPAAVFQSLSEDTQTQQESTQTQQESTDEIMERSQEEAMETENEPDKETENEPEPAEFFSRKVDLLRSVKSEVTRKPRNTLGKIVSGRAITEDITAKLIEDHVEKASKGKKKNFTDQSGSKEKMKQPRTKKEARKVKGKTTETKKRKLAEVQESPKPGPSYVYVDDSIETDTDDDEVPECDRCCVCKQTTPAAVRKSTALTIVKWVQCENCGHWVHLIYCTVIRVVRIGDHFLCHHCES